MDNTQHFLHYYRIVKINPLFQSEQARLHFNAPPTLYRGGSTWRWNPLPLPDYDLWCLLEGEIHFERNGRMRHITPGTAFLLAPDDRIRATPASEERFFVLYAHLEFHSPMGKCLRKEQLDLPEARESVEDLVLLRRLAERAAHYARLQGDYAQAALDGAVREIIMLIHEPERPHEHRQYPRVLELVHAIDADPGLDWSLDAMAAQAALSRSRLSAVFQLLTGDTPNRYLIQRRVERARQLLIESDMTLTQIADSLGYNDVYFFNRQFRQLTGITPGSLRK